MIWSLGNLAALQVTNLTLTVTSPANGVTVTNIASVGTPTGDPAPTNNTTPPVITTVTPQADLQIGKIGPTQVIGLSQVDYSISITNFGPSSASSVIVTDALPVTAGYITASGNGAYLNGTVTWHLGTLAANQITNVTVSVSAPATGALTNMATVGSPESDPNPTNNQTPPVITTVTSQADLAISKNGPVSVLAATTFDYQITVTNLGPATALSVTVTDTLPAGLTFVASTGSGTNAINQVIWNLGNLPAGYTTNLSLTVTAPAAGGNLTNIALVGTPTGDPNPTNNTTPPVLTTVIPQADLLIQKSAADAINAGQVLTYTISISNQGPSAVSSLLVTDMMPAKVIFVGASNSGITNGSFVIWNLGGLAALQVTNLTLTVTAPADGTTLTNFASVGSPTGDPILTNNITPPVITMVVPQADVSLTKSAPGGVLYGTNFTYTLTASNAGPSVASSLTVTDNLPIGVTFVNATPAAITNGANQVVWNLGDLPSVSSTNLTITVLAIQRGALTNIANVVSPISDPVPSNNITPPVVTLVTNDPPVANPDSYSIAENTTNSFSPLINDLVKTPGGVLSLVSVSPNTGTATISGTNVVYTPALNYLGAATINY
ncbi:MAG TPA: Ig-like domain-containing protein, partial [Verrucomicrobiae bacterium]